MPSRDLAISVRGLSKAYTVTHNAERHNTLAETVLHRLRDPFRRAERETFWALRDVSFDVQRGEVLGIIGRNGAGKSTLLKIMSRIAEPAAGQIDLYGRVGSLLEVGTGFHAELTGRENIYLNGQILGMRRAEVHRHFDEIVDFAEVGQFIDMPVKRYSSGMYVRLAFAVAAHLSPEILIVDEVLAVGDQEFQQKCIGKMSSVAQAGRTVLFVSHNLPVVQRLCDRGIVLRAGRVEFDGEVGDAIGAYTRGSGIDTLAFGLKTDLTGAKRVAGSGAARFANVTLFHPMGMASAGEPFRGGDIGFRFELVGDARTVRGVGLHLNDEADRKLVNANTLELDAGLNLRRDDKVEIVLRDVNLRPGRYKVGFWLGAGEEKHIDIVYGDHAIEVLPPLGTTWVSKHDGVFRCPVGFRVVGIDDASAPASYIRRV